MNNNNKETERIKEIIEKEIEQELSLERNNPELNAKKSLRVKTNYLRERLEHLQTKIFFKIDNPNYVRKRV